MISLTDSSSPQWTFVYNVYKALPFTWALMRMDDGACHEGEDFNFFNIEFNPERVKLDEDEYRKREI